MKKVSLFLSRKTLLTIYKSFIRPNLEYKDITGYKPYNMMQILLLLEQLKEFRDCIYQELV